jgi:hypothetical protein
MRSARMHPGIQGLQQVMVMKQLGLTARELLAEGYGVDADRVLDELIRRRRIWEKQLVHEPVSEHSLDKSGTSC